MPPQSPTASDPAKSDPAERRDSQIAAINLGIDFGTSYTKVCFRDVGTEESGVIPFEERNPEGAFIPSEIAVDTGGQLFFGDHVPSGWKVIRVPFLKMRLAEVSLGHALPIVTGIDLNGRQATCALASWFLASVLRRSQEWIARNERDRMAARRLVWSANLGVPVAYCDSEAIKTFEEVLGVAWAWGTSQTIPGNLSQAVSAYEVSVGALDPSKTDFHAIPEIAAAVQSFIASREAVPGIYVYFDIGGGTVDGVAFRFVNRGGARRINFYSGKVESLGISALALALGSDAETVNDAEAVERLLSSASKELKEKFAHRLQLLVGGIVATAKSKDPVDWRQHHSQESDFERRFIGTLAPSSMKPLPIFVGGGGSRSEFYREAIEEAYGKRGLANYNVPPFKLGKVPKPSDLKMGGLDDSEFGRFAVSYGLSIPFGEGPDIGLPSRFTEPDPPPFRKPPGGVDYSDSKDVFE